MTEPVDAAMLVGRWGMLRMYPGTDRRQLRVQPLWGGGDRPHIWAAVTDEQQAAVIFQAAAPGMKQSEGTSGVIRMDAQEWEYRGALIATIRLVCLDSRLDHVFADMVAMIGTRIEQGVPPEQAIPEVLMELRALLGAGAVDAVAKPAPRSDVGLLGELKVLLDLVRYDPLYLHAWTGRKGSRVDFRLGSASLEVKTMVRRQTETVGISSIDQLNPPADGSLWLTLVVLEPDSQGSLTVSALRSTISACLPPELRAEFAGYLADVTDTAEAGAYSLYRQSYYRVGEGFPSLTPGHLKKGKLDPGVSHVSYRLDLSAAGHWHDPQGLLSFIQKIQGQA